MWMGERSKNVAAIFRTEREEQAVLLFDEADAIAACRSTSVNSGSQRESNGVVNVLLQELERYTGVVIFATNPRMHRRVAHQPERNHGRGRRKCVAPTFSSTVN